MWPEMLPCGILFEILAVVVAGEGPPGRPPPVFGHVLNCKKRLSGHLGSDLDVPVEAEASSY